MRRFSGQAARLFVLRAAAVATVLGGLFTTWAGAVRWEHCWGTFGACRTMGDEFYEGAFTGGVRPGGIDESVLLGYAFVALAGLLMALATGNRVLGVVAAAMAVSQGVFGVATTRWQGLVGAPLDAEPLRALVLLSVGGGPVVLGLVGRRLRARTRDDIGSAAWAATAILGLTSSIWLVWLLPQLFSDSWDDPTWSWTWSGVCTVAAGTGLLWVTARMTERAAPARALPPGRPHDGRDLRRLAVAGALVVGGGMCTTWAGAVRWQHCWSTPGACTTMGDQFYTGGYTGGVRPEGIIGPLLTGSTLLCLGLVLLAWVGRRWWPTGAVILLAPSLPLGDWNGLLHQLGRPVPVWFDGLSAPYVLVVLGALVAIGAVGWAASRQDGDRPARLAWRTITCLGATLSIVCWYAIPMTWSDSWDDPTWMWSFDGTCTLLVGLWLVWSAGRQSAEDEAPRPLPQASDPSSVVTRIP